MKWELTAAEIELRFREINAKAPERLSPEEAASLARAEAEDDGIAVTPEDLKRELSDDL